MKKLLIIAVSMTLITNSAQAFLIEEHCDDLQTFEVSNEKACSDICPNRWTSSLLGGTAFTRYACVNSSQDITNTDEDKFMEIIGNTTEGNCSPYEWTQQRQNDPKDPVECVKKAIKEKKDFIHTQDSDGKEYPNIKDLCTEKNGYEFAKIELYQIAEEMCVKKCPKDKPLVGYARDCYSCDTPYEVLLNNERDYANKDTEFKNVCPNRVIIRGSSFKNIINSCNTIEKVKKIIASEKYKDNENGYSEFGRFSLLDWNIMFNHDQEVIKYLLDHDPKAQTGLSFTISLGIDKQAPASVMKLLLERAKKDDLMKYVPHGFLYGVSLESGESWEVPMSFYAKYAGASESMQKLIKSYEKKLGINYEPKLWVDRDE